jgi:hypothetical protein
VTVLRAFQRAMSKWEWEMIREDFSDLEELPAEAIDQELRKRGDKQRRLLAKIFEKYCDAGTKARRVNDALHHGGEEPDYNADTETILWITDKGDTVVIETQMAHNFCFRLRYELVNTAGKWLLRDNRKSASSDGKWGRWDL